MNFCHFEPLRHVLENFLQFSHFSFSRFISIWAALDEFFAVCHNSACTLLEPDSMQWHKTVQFIKGSMLLSLSMFVFILLAPLYQVHVMCKAWRYDIVVATVLDGNVFVLLTVSLYFCFK